MESINLILSIVASVLSIIATFSAYKRKKEIGSVIYTKAMVLMR